MLHWPKSFDDSLEPTWVVELSLTAEPPAPRDDEQDDEPTKTGKLRKVLLQFKWHYAFDPDGSQSPLPVENDFMAQALAGRAIHWVGGDA